MPPFDEQNPPLNWSDQEQPPLNLSAAELEAAIRLTPATLATRISKGRWIPAKHLKYIALRIALGLKRGNARIIISTPPRYGKSRLASVWTPTWCLDQNPAHNVMLASYGADLSTGFSRTVRDQIIEDQKSESPQLKVKVRDDARQVDEWRTTEDGGMYGVGVGGAMTGRGADILIIDDYLKNAQESESFAVRELIWDWWESTAQTRIEPNGSVIIIATRWNTDDLIGRLIAQEGNEWEQIVLPAVAYSPEEIKRVSTIIPGYKDLLGREPGEVLWPDRFDREAVAKRRKGLSSYWWNALYQQIPTLRSSGATNVGKITVIDIIPYERIRTCRSWDLAGNNDEKKGDYMVGARIGVDEAAGYTYVTDMIRTQPTPSQIDDLLVGTAATDGYDVPIVLETEPGAAGQAYKDHVIKLLHGYSVYFVAPTGSKFVRATPFLSAAENGKIRIAKAFWNKEFIEEVALFDQGPNDDQVDAVALGFNYLHRRRFGGVVWGREVTASPTTAETATGTEGNVIRLPQSGVTAPVWRGK